jgi:hypothetical protein
MVSSRFKWKFAILFCVVLLIFGMLSIANAQVRPTNPTMDYVPQNIGIYDTYYGDATHGFQEPDCRVCHGTTTENRHHSTPWAHGDDCLYCHRSYPNIVPAVRDCKVCHTENSTEMMVCSVTTYVGCVTNADCPTGESCVPGDFGYPHHKSDLADSGQCTQCHDATLLSETNTIEPPNKPVGDKTPMPASCENCHWRSEQGTDTWGYTVGATYPDQGTPGNSDEKFEFLQDWLLWAGSPKPTTYPDGNPHPQPIYDNGPQTTGVQWNGAQDVFGLGPGINRFGWLIPGKSGLLSSTGLHHETNGLVLAKCYWCHATAPGLPIDTDAFKQENIKSCENCHDIYTLHGIPEHVCTGGGLDATGWNPCGTSPTLYGGYTITGIRQQTVYAEAGYGNSQKCAACHSNIEPTEPAPPGPGDLVEINDPVPQGGSKGIIVTLTPSNGNFGEKGPADAVKLGQLVEVDTDGCGNDNHICDVGENPIGLVEPKGDGSGNDNCICEAGEICAPGCVYDYITVPTYSWSENQIEFIVPGGSQLDALNNTNLRIVVVKAYDLDPSTPLYNSNVKTFTLRKHPEIYSLTPDSGGYGEEVVIGGSGFGATVTGTIGTGYGYRTYVELHTENDIYRVSEYRNDTGGPSKTWGLVPPSPPWSNASIEVKFENLLDVKTSKRLIDTSQFYKGQFNVKVITDYFKDDGDSVYLLPAMEIPGDGIGNDDGVCSSAEDLQGGCWGAGRLDLTTDPNGYPTHYTGTGDTLIYREISDPMAFTVQAEPSISCVKPSVVPETNTIMLYGANFGPTKGDSYVQICTLNMKTCATLNNKWSNTRIKAKIPNINNGILPKWVYVQVVQTLGHCSATTARTCDNQIDCVRIAQGGNCPNAVCSSGPPLETCNGAVTSNTYPIKITALILP